MLEYNLVWNTILWKILLRDLFYAYIMLTWDSFESFCDECHIYFLKFLGTTFFNGFFFNLTAETMRLYKTEISAWKCTSYMAHICTSQCKGLILTSDHYSGATRA